MKSKVLLLFLVHSLFLSFLICFAQSSIGPGMFSHHYITRDMPGNVKWGYGTPVLTDFDKDGDLDYAFCVREDSLYWFEFISPDQWLRHTVGDMPIDQLGSAALDVDKDGWTDIVVGGVWYRNPRDPRTIKFKKYVYDASIKKEIHDIVIADIDGDGSPDIVVTGENEGCYWYSIPADPLNNKDWKKTVITLSVLVKNERIHGGLYPGGVGDLDGDRDPDVVLPDRWYENRQSGVEWVKHPLPFGKRGIYGLSSRSCIADIDKDGDNDIVVSDADQTDSRVAILENKGGNPPVFTAKFLALNAPGTRGSFHTLVLADFDGDNDLDILAAEQEDPDIFPAGAEPRLYIFENLDGTGKNFIERVIFDIKLGFHDALVGDVDGDGDLDICSKIWNRWLKNSNNGLEHGDFLENTRK